MIEQAVLVALLDSLVDPFVFADTDHTIRFVNRAAVSFYEEGSSLVGSSLLACHNPESQRTIHEVMAALREGEEERLIAENPKHRVFMRAVRDSSGRLIGYYERYEPSARANGGN